MVTGQWPFGKPDKNVALIIEGGGVLANNATTFPLWMPNLSKGHLLKKQEPPEC
jgi:hypothetical protein